MPSKVYFYTKTKPLNTGSGAQVRVYSNIRAYLDLGFDVEVIWLNSNSGDDDTKILHLPVTISAVKEQPGNISLLTRIFYLLGFPKEAVLNYLFPVRKHVQREILKREQTTPGAIHHIEYLDLANAVVGLPHGRYIWSSHDFDSERYYKIQKMRKETGQAKTRIAQAIQHKRLQAAEKWTAAACDLVITIAEHETTLSRQTWGGGHIHLLPMSWPEETPAIRTRNWIADGKLRLFHVGSLNSMVPFSSMRFILEEVFPRLPAELMNRIEFWVAGEISQGQYCQKILQMASAWPQARFLGYVEDIDPLFGQVDAQLVGSQFASGLRTRIIESFARGVPVISTEVAARGVMGMKSGENIILTDSADAFAREIIGLFENHEQLQNLSSRAYTTYRQYYGRDVQAKILHQLIEKHLQ